MVDRKHVLSFTVQSQKEKKILADLSKDPMEENNLIQQFPEVAKEMEELLKTATDEPSTHRMVLGQSR